MASSPISQLELGLFIATPNTVQRHSRLVDEILFDCDTAEGIVNAKVSRDDSSLFAVADSHVVILCDAARGNRKYKLKKGDGEPRLLLFSPNSRTLYFTTTLSPSVQAYSIPTAVMLPSQQPHPSPPNVIAVSSDGSVLLSASPSPPTIYLQDRRRGDSAPVTFQPMDASAPVSCAAFQKHDGLMEPLYTNFLLGFQDGRMVMYRLYLPSQKKQSEHCDADNRMQVCRLQPVRVGATKKLHKPVMGGVIAAEFLPEYKSRIISIGNDGRCRLHVSGPATCLSVIADGPYIYEGRRSGMVLLGEDATAEEDLSYEGSQTFIAIGTQAGKVFVFNILGLLVHEITMDVSIIALEWVGDMSAPSVLRGRDCSMPPKPRPVVDTLLEIAESEFEGEPGTVRKTLSPSKRNVDALRISTGDLFSDNNPCQTRTERLRRPSNKSTGSPVRLLRPGERPHRHSTIRPRIVTETFVSPMASTLRPIDPVPISS
ncbi:WD40-repeat-containing domain protein, partial [Ampelomyces quisqualis]